MKINSVNTCKVFRTVPYSKYYKGLLNKIEYHRTIKITFEEYLKTWKNAHKKSFIKQNYLWNHSNSLSHRELADWLWWTLSQHSSLPLLPNRTTILCWCSLFLPTLYLMGIWPLPGCGRSRNLGSSTAVSTQYPAPSPAPLTLRLRAW